MNKKATELYEKVKAYVLYLRDLNEEESQKETGRYHKSLTKEWMAQKFKAKDHDIEQCFAKLNLEGILTQAEKKRGDDRWSPNRYYLKSSLDSWFEAIKHKDEEKVKRLLKQGIDINTVKGSNSTLIEAVTTKDLRFIRFMLELGAEPSFGDIWYAFVYSRYDKNLQILGLLLEYVKDPSMKDSNGETLLFLAARGFSDITLLLLKRGFSPNVKNNLGQTPLMVAIQNKQLNAVRYLIAYNENFKANLKEKDNNKKTTFMYAFQAADKDILKLFIPIRNELRREEKKLFKKIRMRIIF